MKKNIFHNILMLNVFIVSCPIFWGCEANELSEESSEITGNREKFKILITSSHGLQLSKQNNRDGTISITYDCSLGFDDEGIIELEDKIHPPVMSSLTIKNCYNITLEVCGFRSFNHFEKLEIDNVTYVSIKSKDYDYYYCNQKQRILKSSWFENDVIVSISNCEILEFLGEFLPPERDRKVSVTIQNVFIKTLSTEFINKKSLHFKNVHIENVQEKAINLKDENSVLTVENSRFGYVNSDAFTFNGSAVKIFNNTFRRLEEGAFSINEANSFTFSHNLVENMSNPFHVKSPNVNIVHNTFEMSYKPWFSEITTHTFKTQGVLNITANTIKKLPANFFAMNENNLPDIFYFKNNNFDCTCRYISQLSYRPLSLIKGIFLNKNNKNICVNLGNCPLQTVLENVEDVCSNNFQCAKHQTNEELMYLNLKSILSVLQSIDNKLGSFIVKYDSSPGNKTQSITPDSETSGLLP